MSSKIKSIIIVGGGAAGWLTAGLLATQLKSDHADAVSIRLIESPDIATVGVGEGTWPTMRLTLQRLGIDEWAFMRACDATFKQGTYFVGWERSDQNASYYHPFTRPHGDIAPAWLRQTSPVSFAHAANPQAAVCDANKAPKTRFAPPYAGPLNYGYHLDAGKFGAYLRDHCTQKLGVENIPDTVVGVNSTPIGEIASVTTQNHGHIDGDLFVDCTGFRSLLLGQHYGVGLVSCKDILPVDTALAVHMPYPSANHPIASLTRSTAQDAGWIWDIGLTSRRGIGYVFASHYCDGEAALKTLQNYVQTQGGNLNDLSPRTLTFEPGYREQFWTHNCVAVGLSAGFLEPLEASAMVLIELAANMIAAHFPVTDTDMPRAASRFNRKFHHRWERIIDFLKLHYVLNQRHGEPFWDAHRHPATIPASLSELLEHWQYYTPSAADFDHRDEMFPAESYEYVLYGMGFRTQESHVLARPARLQMAYERIREVPAHTKRLVSDLPDHRAVLNDIQNQVYTPVTPSPFKSAPRTS